MRIYLIWPGHLGAALLYVYGLLFESLWTRDGTYDIESIGILGFLSSPGPQRQQQTLWMLNMSYTKVLKENPHI
jgi:hypothetical protein